MRTYYILISENEILQALPAILSWSHYVELFVLDDINAINYYINIAIDSNISYRELHFRIKNKEYERLDESTKNKLIKKEEITITDFIKNSIVIRNTLNIKDISEKYLKKLILEDIENFMKELGNGYSFIGSEYKIKIGDRFNYVDLLLFNYNYNCFVVIELKICELKKEHIGQIEVYMNYIDRNTKSINHDKTIGIIICKHDNKLVLEYSSDPRIFSTKYILI